MGAQKVFISGVAGFLGSHLARRMLEAGHAVVGCDDLIGGYIDNVPTEVEFYQYDCVYLNSMSKITRGVDVIYHCASTAYEGLSVFSPHLISKNIYVGTASLVSAAMQNGVKRFILCSSMARYGSLAVPFTEDMTPHPCDPYGIAKHGSELLLTNMAAVHGFEHVIAVPHNIIGPGQKYDDPYRNVAAIMVNLILQGRQPIIYGDGNQKRCFTFVDDAINCLEAMASQDNVVGEVINIGPDEEFVTINELAAIIAELMDWKLEPIYVPARPQEVKLAMCSADKARALLGYRTRVDLRSGLQKLIDWIRERGPKPFRYHLDVECVNAYTPTTWKCRLF